MRFLTGGGRIGRLRFLLVALLLGASLAVGAQWTTYRHPVTDEFVIEPAGYAVAVTFVWLQSMNAVGRLHDRNQSGYTVLLGVLPGLNVLLLLYLLFAPSAPTSNRWGPNPFGNPYRAGLNRVIDPESELADRAKVNEQFLDENGSFDFDGLFRERNSGPDV